MRGQAPGHNKRNRTVVSVETLQGKSCATCGGASPMTHMICDFRRQRYARQGFDHRIGHFASMRPQRIERITRMVKIFIRLRCEGCKGLGCVIYGWTGLTITSPSSAAVSHSRVSAQTKYSVRPRRDKSKATASCNASKVRNRRRL